MYVDTDI